MGRQGRAPHAMDMFLMPNQHPLFFVRAPCGGGDEICPIQVSQPILSSAPYPTQEQASCPHFFLTLPDFYHVLQEKLTLLFSSSSGDEA